MFFRIHNTKTHEMFMKDAFDMNALRRNLKKEKGWASIPNSVKIYPVSQVELEHMFRSMMESQQPQDTPTTDETPLVDPLNGFQRIQEAEAELEVLEGKVEEVISEAAAL